MAYNLPMEDAPSIALGKAFTQGTGLYNMLMEHAVKRAQSKRMDDQNRRAEEMQPFNIKKIQSAIANSNAANSRAQQMMNPRLQALKDAHEKFTRESDPNYEINQANKWIEWATSQGATPDEAQSVAKHAIKNNIDADTLPGMTDGQETESELPSINQAMGKESFIPGSGIQQTNQPEQEIEPSISDRKPQYDALRKKIAGAILKKKIGANPFEEEKMSPLQLFIEKEKYKQENPGKGSSSLHGTAAETDSHFRYMKDHPEGTPEGDEEMKQWELKNQSKNILNENRAENTKNSSKKVLTQEAKRAGELDQIEQGINPANGKPLTPERKAQLKASYESKEGNLSKGSQYIFDPESGERVGIERDLKEKERKEIEGRETFNEVMPIITKGLSEYGGKGSYERFLNDTYNYSRDKAAQKRVDDFLLAKSLLTAGTIKEDATLGGANTNQVYNRLLKSLDSSDLKPIVEYVGTSVNLPKTAKFKAGNALPKILEKVTKKANTRVPAKIKEYFEPDKYEKVWVINNETGEKEQITRAEYNKHLEE